MGDDSGHDGGDTLHHLPSAGLGHAQHAQAVGAPIIVLPVLHLAGPTPVSRRCEERGSACRSQSLMWRRQRSGIVKSARCGWPCCSEPAIATPSLHACAVMSHGSQPAHKWLSVNAIASVLTPCGGSAGLGGAGGRSHSRPAEPLRVCPVCRGLEAASGGSKQACGVQEYYQRGNRIRCTQRRMDLRGRLLGRRSQE